MTDSIVASLAFLVLAFTPIPLWRRLQVLPEWRQLKPVMLIARILGPVGFFLLCFASSANVADGLMERLLTTTCVLWIAALGVTLDIEFAHRPCAWSRSLRAEQSDNQVTRFGSWRELGLHPGVPPVPARALTLPNIDGKGRV